MKFGVSAGFLKGDSKLIKSDSKDIYNVTKDFCCSFELSIHQRIVKNKMHHGFHKKKYCAAQLFSILIIIRNVC